MAGVVTALQVVAAVGGALLIYAGLFLREAEERQVESVLEAWWIRIDDFRREALSWHFAVARGAAQLASNSLDRVFGERLLSVRAVSASACLSFASIHFAISYIYVRSLNVIQHGPPESRLDVIWPVATYLLQLALPLDPVVLHVAGVVAIVSVLLGATHPKFGPAPVGGIVFVLAFLLTHFVLMAMCCMSGAVGFVLLVVAVTLGVAADFVAMVIVRALLREQAATERFAVVLGISAAELTLALVLVGGPPLMMWFVVGRNVGCLVFVSAWLFGISALTNLPAAIFALALVWASGLLLLHRLLWPFVERPLYRLAAVGVFRNKLTRAALIAVGTEAVATGLGHGGAVSRTLWRLIQFA